MQAALPVGVTVSTAVATESAIYVFGSTSAVGATSAIWRYDPQQDRLTLEVVSAPFLLGESAAVWDGEAIYLYGGSGCYADCYIAYAECDHCGYSDLIVRYDPLTNIIEALPERLPHSLASASAVWTGSNTLIFGGYSPQISLSAAVLLHDPSDGDVSHVATLPSRRYDTTAFALDGDAYVVGGISWGEPHAEREVVRVDSATYAVEVLSTRAPRDLSVAAAAWTGQFVLFIGGYSYGDGDLLLRYDPSSSVFEALGGLPGAALVEAVWVGDRALLFGGFSCEYTACRASDQVLEFDPLTRRAKYLPVTLPSPRYQMVPVWTGKQVLLFGGFETVDSEYGYQDVQVRELLKYDPESQTFSTHPLNHTAVAYRSSAVWTGNEVLVFGVWANYRPQVLKFDPDTNAVSLQEGPGSWRYDGTRAVWDGEQVLLFGGLHSYSVEVARYDPVNHTMTLTGAKIDEAYAPGSVIWTGERAYLLGVAECEPTALALLWGDHYFTRTCNTSSIYRYDPHTNALDRMSAELHMQHDGVRAAVWTGEEAFLFGSGWAIAARRISSYTLEPGAPSDARAWPSFEGTRVEWAPPPANSLDGNVTKYLVYRADGEERLLLGETTGQAIFDEECRLPRVCQYEVRAENAHGPGPAAETSIAGLTPP